MDLEVKRDIFHIISGTALALLFSYSILDKTHFLMLLSVSIVLFVLYRFIKIPGVHHFLEALERPRNIKKNLAGIGALFYMIGITLAVWLFSKDVATAAMLVLAWGDSASRFIGPKGKVKYLNPHKTWEGIIAGIIAATIAAQFFVPLWHALVASSAAMLIEGLDVKIGKLKIDDNLFIPLIAGYVLNFLA